MKKNLKKILLIIVSTFAILLIIQTVDWVINGKEYRAIDEYIEQSNQVSKTSYGKIFFQNGKNSIIEIIRESISNNANQKVEISEKDLDNYIKSGSIIIDDYKKLQVPKNISFPKDELLKKYTNNKIIITEFYIQLLQDVKACEYDKHCIENVFYNSLYVNNKITDYVLDNTIYIIKIKKKLSIRSMLTSDAMLFILDAKRKELEQMKGK